VTLLGSTGSIGRQALDVIAASPEEFVVEGMAAGSDAETMTAQLRAHHPRWVAMADRSAAETVRRAAPAEVKVLDGADGVAELAAAPVDVVLNGMVGSRGLRPTLAALTAGNRVALANKESLVAGGPLVAEAVGGRAALETGELLVPVDSEHSALAQCLRAGTRGEVARLVVTASGGPFRGATRDQLATVTREDALAHPTWSMGEVITVNSATLANKGLEVVEAHWLFGLDFDRIDVVVHPQSIVHGMVEFANGATVAELSPPDMRLPIQLALAWPTRLDHAAHRMDWTRAQALEFEPVDAETFRMLELMTAAGQRGETYPGVANAANEEAVAAFLGGRIGFLDIPGVVEAVLEAHEPPGTLALGDVLAAEEWARRRAHTELDRRTGAAVARQEADREGAR
jgi:1-deoxy-D-xylulose-5-phosphate reductoisomerase